MLPPSPDDLAALLRDEARLRPALDAIRARHDLPGDPARYPTGSLPVWAVGDAVIKLYPPSDRDHWDTEVAVLRGIRLPVATPGVRHADALGAWTYLVMDRLPGAPLDAVWETLPANTRRGLAAQVGELVAALHAGPPVLPDAFAPFVAAQVAGCAARQRRYGLEEAWAEQIDDWLRRHPPEVTGRALLHTEVMPAHLLAEDGRLTGLVDFEPAMVGAPEYELASIGVFVGAGDPSVFDAFVRAWRGPADPGLPARVLTWSLLHRYSRLRWYLDRLGAPGDRLDDLLAWFTT